MGKFLLKSLHTGIYCFSLRFFVMNSKTWKLAFKSRDHRHLATDRNFKVKYQ